MQYDQVISGNLAGSDSVFARGIVLPHVGPAKDKLAVCESNVLFPKEWPFPDEII